jgi:hypothetical protein
VGRYDLRLAEAAFWALTPREYRALADRHAEYGRTEDRRIGELAALVASVAGSKKPNGQPWLPEDIFPSLKTGTAPTTRPAAPVRAGGDDDKHYDVVSGGWVAWAEQARQAAERRGMPVEGPGIG